MDFYKNAINAGYYPNEEVIKENSLLNSNFDIMILVVKNNPEYIKYYSGYDMFALKALTTEYIPTYEEVNSSYRVRSNYILMKKLINIDSKYVELVDYQVGQKEYIELYELAIDLGYKLNFEKIQNNYWLFSSDKIMEELIKIDSNFILKYNGTNIKIFELAINLGYEPWKDYKSILQYCKYEQEAKKINLLIANFIKTKDFSMLKESEINQMYDYYRLLKIAIEFGYEPSIEEINSITIKAFDDNLLMKIIDSSSEEECINLIFRASLNEVLKDYIRKSKNINISDEYFYLLRDYNFDRAKLIYNYEKFQDILGQINIDESKFIQYGIAISYDWFTDMLKIYDSNKIDEFNTVKKYFFDNYYFKNESDYSDVYLVKCIINILKNYIKYPELCLNIVNNNIQLDLNIIDNIKFIFENNTTIEDNIKPKTVEDLKNIENLFITKYKNDLENIEFKDIEEIKNTLCQLLFNANYYDILNRLSIYGNTKDLRQLLFNNRNNFEIIDDIAEMMIYTSMMEAIINSNDKAYLTETVKRVLENYKLSAKCLMLFNQFEDKMRELYENELIANLTNLDEDLKESILDKGMSNLYGIDVIDLSTKKYCLLEHTKSPSETVEELVLGKSSGDKNTICLSVGSHRNQLLYSSYNRIIFATDSIPNNSFIRSSISNMGSNGSVVNNSFEDNGSFNVRTQRGAIETSQAVRGNNSEVLCFRSDIKFKYIVLPGGRSPTQEELDIAKDYNLKFIKVQELNKTIENPVDLAEKEKNEKLSQSETIGLEKLKEVKEKLLSISSGPRKIAIFSDVHALFEPTLAILEDAKKNGISEIYSLGDNIGTGPNPREVVELLKEYNVESLKGNHEIYTVDGIDELKEHLGKTGAYEEAKRNSTWTREQLTEELLSKIKDDKEYRTIEVGGKKVLLTHYTKDYNTGEVRDLPVADEVFQGHIHFEGQNDKLNTLRGAGIGHKDSDTHKAYYLILTERTDGGYDIEKRYVDYDYDSLYHDINESDMAKEDKNKIENWAGVQRK